MGTILFLCYFSEPLMWMLVSTRSVCLSKIGTQRIITCAVITKYDAMGV